MKNYDWSVSVTPTWTPEHGFSGSFSADVLMSEKATEEDVLALYEEEFTAKLKIGNHQDSTEFKAGESFILEIPQAKDGDKWQLSIGEKVVKFGQIAEGVEVKPTEDDVKAIEEDAELRRAEEENPEG